MNARKFLIVFLVLGLMLSLVTVGLAQEVTETPPSVEETATVEPTAIVVTVIATEPAPEPAPDPDPEPEPSGFTPGQVAQIAAYIFLAIMAGGGIVAMLYRALESREIRDRVEMAYNSWSPDQQEFVKTLVEQGDETQRRIFEFLRAVTDGKANTPKLE